MSATQNEFVFNEIQKTDNHVELPKPTSHLNGVGKNTAHVKPKKKRRGSPAGTQPAAVSAKTLVPPPNLFLSDREVARRYSVSRPTVWRWVKEVDSFPQPVKIAKGTTRWRLNDLEEYERACGSLPIGLSTQSGEAK